MQKLTVEIRIESEFDGYTAKDIERALNRAFLTSADFYVTETRLTKRAVDEGESAPSQAESTPEHLPIEEADTTPALRN